MLLRRSDVAELLSLQDCIEAVEEALRLQGEGKIPAPGILSVKADRGGLHIKAGLLPGRNSYVVAKLNTNFTGNWAQFGRPTIQGVIVVYDATNGSTLALLDSIDVTIKRTAAASAIAAKYLARMNSSIATICGCGQQARAQVHALNAVLRLNKVHLFDLDEGAARNLAPELKDELGIEIEVVGDLRRAIQESDVCVTCTTSREFFVRNEDVSPGTFIAAVGADAEDKQEIEPTLVASAKVVADNLDQSCTIGDAHHAIAQGLMRREDVYAELAEIVAGNKPGRTSEAETILFDSTGIALEDAVAAAAVYEKASQAGIGKYFNFAA
jgi:ornithine cyclodeaminase/alanine dehydrogenase-like protein (mu-crystallin family)